MIKIIPIIICISFFAADTLVAKRTALPSLTQQQEGVKQSDFSFDHQSFDFGKFPRKKKKTHTFVFTNTGNAPLLILHIATGCGCTTTSYTKEPIQPGKKGEIKVQFDGSGLRPGIFRKTVTVYTNSPKNYTRLAVSGETTE